MSLSARWHRLDAARWVHRLLLLHVVLLGLATVVVFLAGLVRGGLPIVVVPLVLTGVAGWFAQAWNDERPWSWWVIMTTTALAAGGNLLGLASGLSSWRLAWLPVDAVVLALLAHPDSTARLGPRQQPARGPRWIPERPPRG